MSGFAQRALTKVFDHSEPWGMGWFGMLFWGSVICAGGMPPSGYTAAT